jgi:hypothetical protein
LDVACLILSRSCFWHGWQSINAGRATATAADSLAGALNRCVRGGREFGARAVVVDAIDDAATAFYMHFGFRRLDGRRLWRKLSDIADSLGGR